jgi:hypothetical protein
MHACRCIPPRCFSSRCFPSALLPLALFSCPRCSPVGFPSATENLPCTRPCATAGDLHHGAEPPGPRELHGHIHHGAAARRLRVQADRALLPQPPRVLCAVPAQEADEDRVRLLLRSPSPHPSSFTPLPRPAQRVGGWLLLRSPSSPLPSTPLPSPFTPLPRAAPPHPLLVTSRVTTH